MSADESNESPAGDGRTRSDGAAADPVPDATADSTVDRPSGDDEGDDGDGVEESTPGRRGRREVVVPMRVYKTVTVFSTLIAVVGVVVGFVFLDAATLGVSVLRSLVVAALSLVGLSVPDDVLSAVLAAVGLGAIAAGAGVYILGTRFRAGGMGKSQEDSGEPSNNG